MGTAVNFLIWLKLKLSYICVFYWLFLCWCLCLYWLFSKMVKFFLLLDQFILVVILSLWLNFLIKFFGLNVPLSKMCLYYVYCPLLIFITTVSTIYFVNIVGSIILICRNNLSFCFIMSECASVYSCFLTTSRSGSLELIV